MTPPRRLAMLDEAVTSIRELLTGDEVAIAGDHFLTGDDIGAIVDSLRSYADAGFDAVALHNVGEDHAPFLDFAGSAVLDEARRQLAAA